jgi:hypothetical protein
MIFRLTFVSGEPLGFGKVFPATFLCAEVASEAG